jgi:uncharacterized protein with HEPN domain
VKDERAYLLHAIEAIDAILSYTVDGREAFLADGKTQDALVWDVVERELPVLRPQLEKLSQCLAEAASSEDRPTP